MTRRHKVRQHLRSNVVGYVAMFFALTGVATAVNGPLPGKSKVGSADIIDEDVRTRDIKDNHVRAADIRVNAVGSSEIEENAVESSELGTGVVSSEELAGIHVHSTSQTNIIGGGDNNGVFNNASAKASCTSGEKLVGWDISWPTMSGGEEVQIMEVEPDFTGEQGVTITAGTDEDTNESFVVSAWCLAA